MKTINVKKTASKGVVMGKAYVLKRPASIPMDTTFYIPRWLVMG